MANMPNGATIMVEVICAPHMMTRSQPMGIPIFTALRSTMLVGLKFVRRLSSVFLRPKMRR